MKKTLLFFIVFTSICICSHAQQGASVSLKAKTTTTQNKVLFSLPPEELDEDFDDSFTDYEVTTFPEAVGRVAGELAVSSTGAATYLVPIALPPGVKEVVPSLALSYNSQGGNGIAGWGWNIAGLSTISRIGATLFHDGVIDPVDFDALDRFALDGQRLILVEGDHYGADGSVYATENYSNIKVVASGEWDVQGTDVPLEFVVHYPDGSRAWYGFPTSGMLEWAINRWQDPQGNSILYRYTKDGGSLRADKIY